MTAVHLTERRALLKCGALSGRGHLPVTAALRSQGLLRAACLAPPTGGRRPTLRGRGWPSGWVPAQGALLGCGPQGRLPMTRPAPRWTSPTQAECPRSRHRPIESPYPQFQHTAAHSRPTQRQMTELRTLQCHLGVPPQLVSCSRNTERSSPAPFPHNRLPFVLMVIPPSFFNQQV